MVDPISISVVIGMLAKNAPGWFHALENTIMSNGKTVLTDKGKAGIQTFFDEKKHRRNIELALQNAAEQGLKHYTTSEERDIYRSLLQLLAEDQNTALREEALRLFTLSDDPDLARLNEKYQLSQRVTALANHQIVDQIDATPYLHSFFSALLAAFYNDPLFRAQMSDVIKVRAAMNSTQLLAELVSTMRIIQGELVQAYSPTQFQDEISIYLNYIEAKMRYHKFAGIVFRGDEDKAPELENIFEPLRILLLQNSPSKSDENSNDLSSLLEQHPYLVLLGGPGSGKSTTTRYLTWSYARTNITPAPNQVISLRGQFVPLQIELRLFSEARHQLPGCSFLAYATDVLLKREDISVSTQMFLQLLERRAMFLLFDGLDEVSSLNERRQLVEEIENFAQRYPGNRILVTSRPVGYEIASFTNPLFRHCQMQDFNDNQIQSFLQRWYRHVLKYETLSRDIEQELDTFCDALLENERLHRLAVNPLLLTVMATLHRYERLPNERVLVYEKCADLLLDIWAKLKYEGTRWKDMKMGKRDQIACLAHLGFFLHQRSQEELFDEDTMEGHREVASQDTAVDVPERTIYKEIKNFLLDQNLFTGAEQNIEAERFLALARTEAGLLVSRGTNENGEQLYGFVHRTFQEYFAAMDVLERYQQETDIKIVSDFLVEHVHDPHWHEVILLLLGKLPRKVVTAQLRYILNGENRRSKYADVVQQNLFFTCDCLSEGITVERDFALNVVSKINLLVKKSPFPSQIDGAFSRLVKLLQTRLYRDMGRQALVSFITEDTYSDLALKIRAAKAIYKYSTENSDEQREGLKLFINVYTKIKYGKRANWPLEQLIQVASAVSCYSSENSYEQQECARLLIAYGQRADLSLEQLIQIVEAIHNYGPEDSDEQREGARLLIAYGQRADLALEQLIQVTSAVSRYSPKNSNEQREGARLLIEYGKRADLSLEQLIQVASTVSRYSPENSDEQREGLKQLIAYEQREDLSLESRVQVAEAIYCYSSSGSDAQREWFKRLIAYEQRKDLSLEHQIQIAEIIYNNSIVGTDEEKEGFKQLIAYGQRADLSLEHQMQIAEIIYWSNPDDSDEQRKVLQKVWQLASNPAIVLEKRVQMTVLPCTRFYEDNFNERAEAVQLLLTLISHKAAKKYLEKQWEPMPSEKLLYTRERVLSDTHMVANMDSIYKLACQKVLPTTTRDAMYKLLSDMVSLLVLC